MSNSDTLAIVFPGQVRMSHTELLDGFWKTSSSRGYRTMALHGLFEATYEYIDLKRIAGIAVLYSLIGNEWLLQLEPKIPLVIICPDQPYPDISSISADYVGGSRSIVEHLIEHGHEHIAFIGSLSYSDIARRYQGYELALKQAQIAIDPELIIDLSSYATQNRDAIGNAIEQLLGSGKRFTAMYAATDELAAMVYEVLQKAGLKIPDDIAVVGFNDIPTASTIFPGLTTVRQSNTDLGTVAARRLIEMSQTNDYVAQEYGIMGHIVTRRSCGCPPLFLRDGLFPQSRQSGIDTEQHIFALAEIFAHTTMLSTTDGIVYARPLYHSFRSALHLDGVDAWVTTLEQQIPVLVSRDDLKRNLPLVFSALKNMASAMQRFSDDSHSLEQRAEELIMIAERAVAMYGTIDTQNQYNHWLSVGSTFQQIMNTMLGFHDDSNPFPILSRESLLALRWLRTSDIRQAALFLRDQHTFEIHCEQVLGLEKALVDRQKPMVHIPPAALLPEDMTTLMVIYSLISDQDALGMFYFILEEGQSLLSYNNHGLWINQFAALLQRMNLEADLQQNNRTIQALYQQERALIDIVRELAVPVVPLMQGIVALPLVGTIDTQRAQQIISNLLGAVSEYNAEIVIVDITGVPLVDTQTATYLIQATQALQLLGAHTILTGIRPEIAQTIVHLGIDTHQLTTAASMESALRQALAMRGLQVSPMKGAAHEFR